MEQMNWSEHVRVDSTGSAVVGAPPVAVEDILIALAESGINSARSKFPQLGEAEIRACLAYAGELVAANSASSLSKEEEAGVLAALESVRQGRVVEADVAFKRLRDIATRG